jgi:hypothetical protein
MPQDEAGGSRFRAFWSSLPGVLTGIAAVITAVVTLAALFRGGDDSGSDETRDAEAATTVPGPAGDGCFSEYFKGIPAYRLGTVEAGAYDDVLTSTEPKAGPLGMTFTDFGRLIGGIRFAFFPANTFFRIESIVDASCNPIDYENPLGSDKQSWRDSSDVTFELDDGFYAVNASGGGNIVRFSFRPVAP